MYFKILLQQNVAKNKYFIIFIDFRIKKPHEEVLLVTKIAKIIIFYNKIVVKY